MHMPHHLYPFSHQLLTILKQEFILVLHNKLGENEGQDSTWYTFDGRKKK
jgi:hypothetical protein